MRWVVRLIGLVLVLVVVAVAAVFLVPAERIAALAARQFEAATGRALVIEGSVRPSVWPVIGARAEDVTLANMQGSDAGPMLTAEVIDIGVDLAALIGGSVEVRTFDVRAPRIVLERAADGRANWIFDGLGGGGADDAAGASGAGGGAAPVIALERAVISGATLRYIDRVSGTDITLDGIDLSLAMPEAGGAADLTLTARRGGATARVEARLGSVGGLLAGEVVAIAASVATDGAEIGFQGRASLDPLALDGRLTASGRQLASLMALAGQGGAEPLPAGARPLTVDAQVTLAPVGSLHLRDAVLGLGDSRISAALDLTFDGPRPRLAGTLASPSLDLAPFVAGGGGDDAGGGGAVGWPRDPIDASALGALDASLGLDLTAVRTGYGELDRRRGSLTIDRSRAVLALTEVRAFDGTVTGELVANNRSGLSVGGNLAARGVTLLPLLRAATGFERLTGTASMDLRFLGVGQSVDAILRSLEGGGRLDLGAGEIIGLDLAGMLRNLDASHVGAGSRTIYDSVTGGFSIANGVLTSDDLRLTASLLNVAGNGTVDIGGQTLAYRVTPEAMRNAETGEALRVPLLITGPWSAPRFRLDLEGLAEQRLAEERARLEAAARAEAERLQAEARARAEQAVQQQLGVTPAEGQTTEDAVRQGVQDAVQTRLQQLLGGGTAPAPAPDSTPPAADPDATPPENTGD